MFLCFSFSCFCFSMFLFLYLCSFASFQFNVLIDLITWYSQSRNKINHVLFTLFWSSQRRCFIKKAVFKNFAIFSWKHLCWGLILIKLQGFSSATLSKRDSNTGVIIAKFLRIPIWRTSPNGCFCLFKRSVQI